MEILTSILTGAVFTIATFVLAYGIAFFASRGWHEGKPTQEHNIIWHDKSKDKS